ncbi:hypothetical protein [Aquimarina algiphila]|uniref:hypothetical protein n=1 Tax=Aquimarina algiphila TaxID=2047982 RepID=UPI00232ED636|nr:hypothetical protein [Aquimarina algiphila]
MRVLLFLLIFCINITTAQENDTICYYANGYIAFQKIRDSVFFYNSSGNLTRLIDLKARKSTPYGLPREVQNMIFFQNPKQKRADISTFPSYLYTQISVNAGLVLCDKKIYYNDLGLKKGYIERCPDDSGGEDYIFGKQNLYQYNDFGQLTTIKGDTIRVYNKNGQMIHFFRRNYFSGKIFNIYNYHYSDDKLIKKENFDTEYEDSFLESVSKYEYDSKNRLEIIKNYNIYKGNEVLQSTILFKYNRRDLIIEVKKKSLLGDFYVLLGYTYDKSNRITYTYMYPNEKLNYEYDEKGNLINVLKNGKTITKYRYDSIGKLTRCAFRKSCANC